MNVQNSYEQARSILYLVPTPIGNLEDMTFRAVRTLQTVDVIAAEDTRNTKKLCHHFEIDTPLMSVHEHNERASIAPIIERLEEGQCVALVSDAGTPCISDPGVHVVRAVIEAGYTVVPLPGANAAITALIASGIVPQPFMFYGFVSRKKKERMAEWQQLLMRKETVILYESPHRLVDTVEEIAERVAPHREIVLAREVTKRFEQFIRGTCEEVVEWVRHSPIRGEFCIMISPALEEEEAVEESVWWESLTIEEHVNTLMMQRQIRVKEAIRQVAVERNMSRREVYNTYHQ